MGHADFYPFVVPSTVVKKLAFVHRAVRDRTASDISRIKSGVSAHAEFGDVLWP
ncbi:hypothetical protein [Hyphomicrobium sp.]|uniref:hypothetical protein n=1 Tax=Hyphomicrobium sp. TaxID=82 RepID=UPI003F728F82